MDKPFAALLNRLLAEQPGAAARLQGHAGKRLGIVLPVARLDLMVTAEGHFVAHDATCCDCEIRLPPSLFIVLPLAGDTALRFAQVSGDGQLASDLLALLRRLDWAVALAPYLGPIAAARAEQILTRLAGQHTALRTAVADALADTLVHEARLLAEGEAVRDFVREVDELREAADRLAARLALLEGRMS